MPANTNTNPNIINKLLANDAEAIFSAISEITKLCVAPYSMDIPYKRIPEATAPIIKYFIAASAQTVESRLNAIIAYNGKDNNSKPK